MRLVIATPLYPPEPGGPATYAALLERALPKRGIEVTLVRFSEVRHLPTGFRHIAYAWHVWRAAQGARLVYALDPVSTGLPALIGAIGAGVPFYVRIAGDYAWEQGRQRFGVQEMLDDFVQQNHYPFFVRLLKWIQSTVARAARRVVVPSQYLQRVISYWGVPERRISVVYNTPTYDTGALRPQRPKEMEGPYLITIARLVPWKGIDGVIRALGKLRAGGSPLSLAVVGSGPEEARLRALTEKLSLTDAVVFTGALAHESARSYLAHADALVLHTQYEGFSHVIIEAFALGVPVITTAVGGNPEAVIDGETGLMVSYEDADAIVAAVTKLANDPGLTGRIVRNARAKAATLTSEKTVTGTLEALALV